MKTIKPPIPHRPDKPLPPGAWTVSSIEQRARVQRQQEREAQSKMTKWLAWVVVATLTFGAVTVAVQQEFDTSNPSQSVESAPEQNSASSSGHLSEGEHFPTGPESDANTEPTEPTYTAGQENAIRSAKGYLDMMPFSKNGLIEQLRFEKYSLADARFAVNHIWVNWNEQAARSAREYLDMMPFSREGLIEQLMYEGFTLEQATYGVNKTGL